MTCPFGADCRHRKPGAAADDIPAADKDCDVLDVLMADDEGDSKEVEAALQGLQPTQSEKQGEKPSRSKRGEGRMLWPFAYGFTYYDKILREIGQGETASSLSYVTTTAHPGPMAR